ncbi:MAG: winged helix-turn-helix transcriptional regulator [Candidatus Hodarchaeales archaeon]
MNSEPDLNIDFGPELPNEIVVTLNLIGKKWIMPVLYTLNEKTILGFNEMKRELKGRISSNMLNKILIELQDRKLIDKRIVSTSPIRVEYSLTMNGEDLCILCMSLASFGAKYLMSN